MSEQNLATPELSWSMAMKGFLFSFFVLFLAVSPACAADDAGAVKEVTGEVKILREKAEPVAATVGEPVFEKDVIEMSEGARAVIGFADGAELVISGKGRLEVDKFLYDADKPEKSSAVLGIFNAAFSYVGGLMDKSKDTNVRIDMDYGSIGIRGTTVYGMMKNNVNWVYLEKGAVTVKNGGGMVELTNGYGTSFIGKEETPRPAWLWGEDQIAWIKRAVTDPSSLYAPAMASNTLRQREAVGKKAARAEEEAQAGAGGAPPALGRAAGRVDMAAKTSEAPAASAPVAPAEAKAEVVAADIAPKDIAVIEKVSPETVGVKLLREKGGALRVETKWPVTVNLAEVDVSKEKLQDTVLHYKADLMSSDLKGAAYLEMWVHFPGEEGGYFFSRGLGDMLQGETEDWQTFQTPFFLKKGQMPDSVILNLVIKGKGSVSVKNIRLQAGR